MKEFLAKINERNDHNKYIVVLDNLAAHKTPKVKRFFDENKINIIYNTPYASMFNFLELSFRYLKRHLYNNLYNTLDDAENDTKKLLENNNINLTLLKNYRETLNTYLLYYLKNQYKNLNNLNYDI